MNVPAMPRFVLLRHECPPGFDIPSHWDFMLEDGGALLTWRLMQLPANQEPIPATRLADHRLAYLDFEGPLSENRGSVRRIDSGTFTWLERRPECMHLELAGRRLRGSVELEQVAAEYWRLVLR
jgi:hypothetical protein